jgi:hypothetical protein
VSTEKFDASPVCRCQRNARAPKALRCAVEMVPVCSMRHMVFGYHPAERSCVILIVGVERHHALAEPQWVKHSSVAYADDTNCRATKTADEYRSTRVTMADGRWPCVRRQSIFTHPPRIGRFGITGRIPRALSSSSLAARLRGFATNGFATSSSTLLRVVVIAEVGLLGAGDVSTEQPYVGGAIAAGSQAR